MSKCFHFSLLGLAVIGLTTTLFYSCDKNDFENKKTLKALYKNYKHGSISECTYNGETVYRAAIEAFDAGEGIYDKDGRQIGACDYAWGTVDSICYKLEDCNIIYRYKNNLSGLPAVDVYGLD